MSALHYITILAIFLALTNMAYGFILPVPILAPYPRTLSVIEDYSPVYLPHAADQRYIPVTAHHTI